MTIEIPENCHFTLQNIPFGVFSVTSEGLERLRIGTAIGEYAVEIVCLPLPSIEGNSTLKRALEQTTLNDFMAMGRPVWRQLRLDLQAYFSNLKEIPQRGFYLLNQVLMHLPISVGDYTDFYASKEHATNVGEMFRGRENALMPNWLHLPVGYHGRASSIVVSGTPIKRPSGQCKPDPQAGPVFKPTSKLDFELEMGFVIGVGNELGSSIPVDRANEHIFGVCLLNDWSARDIQAWEYVPLGPFLGKNFGTTISAWIVTLDALEPFTTAGPEQASPSPLEYLQGERGNQNYDISLKVKINDTVVCTSNLKYMYWSFAQQLAHHTINGCNMRPGDICGTGTISGPQKDSFGSLLELSWNGSQPITLTDGSTRTFLQNGDNVSMTGFCLGEDGKIAVGFGECSGRII